jgi:seryl-tRNA synthetase
MIDIRLARENPDLVRKNLRRRGDPEVLERLDKAIRKDREWRDSLKRLEALRKEKNQITDRIAVLKRGGKPAAKEMARARELPARIKGLEERNEKQAAEARALLMRVPNLLHESVPEGKDDSDNEEVRRWGRPPKFDFHPRNHEDMLIGMGLLDTESAGRASGAGFYYLKGGLALLDMALQRYAIDLLRKRGFTLVYPPFMLRRKPYEGVTDLGDFESVMYKIEGDDLYLIATSEHPMGAMHMGATLERKDLPLRMCGVSACFRREVGSHGKYTKGLFRVHQFNKVEQFVFCHPDDSWAIHEELQKNSEDLYQGLGLHYRVVNVCTGDIGPIAAKKYDTEAWMADGAFREVGSNSNCTDYQARRLGTRFREKEGQSPVGFVHTLNNTALATSRTMVAIIEQFQNPDGTVTIPEVLRPYMGGVHRLGRK